MQKTLGGDRLGAGKKQKVELKNFERSTHDLGYIWRSTMSAGTLVPFLSEIALPGDTFDINLEADIKTHPTVGPLFGSYKVQLDVFQAPIRLYNSLLHNNALGIGMKMSQVKLPVIKLKAQAMDTDTITDLDNCQINPSCILSYLGLRGIGSLADGVNGVTRTFNALPLLAYWDVYKNYYANKQEAWGAVLHTPQANLSEATAATRVRANSTPDVSFEIFPSYNNVAVIANDRINLAHTAPIDYNLVLFRVEGLGILSYQQLTGGNYAPTTGGTTGLFNSQRYGSVVILNWRNAGKTQPVTVSPRVEIFDLSYLDTIREQILSFVSRVAPFEITAASPEPLSYLFEEGDSTALLSSQEGLAIKTYQSDLFNNWLLTDYIDGPDGISAVTAISTVGDSFTIDTLNLSKKVYNMLNRIAVSGGSYDDWLDAVYTHDRYKRAETPMYMGGLIKELVFQEVVSNSQDETQPLGTLAGKGVMAKKHKGGNVVVKVDEPSYIIGLISLTPRIDYSQGNKWDLNLETLDDLHKPDLDQIGFQDLITEQMAWWDTRYDGTKWVQKSAGKQPAWINYMTNVNQTRGNFAIANNEMFMTLNRRYEGDKDAGIQDLTTYIDPSKFNFIFAQTSLDSQNFWAQIAVNITARRKMSAKVMPNL